METLFLLASNRIASCAVSFSKFIIFLLTYKYHSNGRPTQFICPSMCLR